MSMVANGDFRLCKFDLVRMMGQRVQNPRDLTCPKLLSSTLFQQILRPYKGSSTVLRNISVIDHKFCLHFDKIEAFSLRRPNFGQILPNINKIRRNQLPLPQTRLCPLLFNKTILIINVSVYPLLFNQRLPLDATRDFRIQLLLYSIVYIYIYW